MPVRHALYHHKGTWFHHLTAFPGGLFDAEGCVIFDSETEYRNYPGLRFNQHFSCPAGISALPGYRRFQNRAASDIEENLLPHRTPTTISRIIRDTALSSELKLIYEHECQICGSIVELTDGRYSEAHHLRPLGRPHNGSDIRENLIVVCPTCHVKLDYFSIPIEMARLHVVKHQISRESLDYHNENHRRLVGEACE